RPDRELDVRQPRAGRMGRRVVGAGGRNTGGDRGHDEAPSGPPAVSAGTGSGSPSPSGWSGSAWASASTSGSVGGSSALAYTPASSTSTPITSTQIRW